MPELPEVETLRRQLSKEVVGRTIKSVWSDTPKMLRPSAEEFITRVKGRKILGYSRRAKQMFIDMDRGIAVALHLKLNGRILHRGITDPVDPYVHIRLELDDSTELRFADSRKFGYMEVLINEGQKRHIVEKYGPEPLDDLTLGEFQSLVLRSKKRIKDILMDQSRIAGIGNIYANDALWLAKVHPETAGNKLTKPEVALLLEAIESVIKEALKDGGASDQWYRQLHGEKGHYQEHFKVYGQTGKACKRHPAEKIEYHKVSQRGTFICRECQKLR